MGASDFRHFHQPYTQFTFVGHRPLDDSRLGREDESVLLKELMGRKLVEVVVERACHGERTVFVEGDRPSCRKDPSLLNQTTDTSDDHLPRDVALKGPRKFTQAVSIFWLRPTCTQAS